MNFYNSHIHTFTSVDVPDKFLPFALVRILRTVLGYKIVTGVLKHIIPFTDNDIFDRYARFVEIGKLGSQQKIFDTCAMYYPLSTKFIVLSMDLAFMKAGRVKRNYIEQLNELATISISTGRIYPFIHADPRREGIFDLVKHAIEDLKFKGLKIYPNIGYLPFDDRLYSIYEYCEHNRIPVIAHGSPINAVYFRGNRLETLQLLSNSLVPVDEVGKSNKELCAYFSHPLNFEKVIKDFPNLKYCIAHFGSEHYWNEYIKNPSNPGNWFVHVQRLIRENSNVYTDVSFTMNNRELFPLLKIVLTDLAIRSKVLFGSDFYMVETRANERRFGLDLRAYLGEEYFGDIAVKNPKQFLGVQ